MATPAPSARPAPLRRRILVPSGDTTVLDWWDLQEDPSVSIRLLVREWVARQGMTDPMCRPVAQLPRRGRPPVEPGDDRDGAQPAQHEGASEPTRPRLVEVTDPEPEPTPSDDGQVDVNELFSMGHLAQPGA